MTARRTPLQRRPSLMLKIITFFLAKDGVSAYVKYGTRVYRERT
jgi:hypothetical protein